MHYLKSNNMINFPGKGEFTSPDVIITAASLRFGLEVTRLEWQAQAQALNTSSGKAIPITQALSVDKPLKSISKEDRAKVLGWIGDETLSNTLALLQARVQGKSKKLNAYRHNVTSNWLFLIDNHDFHGDWDSITGDPMHRQTVSQICEPSGFEKVLLFRWDRTDRFENVTILYSDTTCKPSRQIP
jgi:chromosome condensin MukBEF MukE localization factor